MLSLAALAALVGGMRAADGGYLTVRVTDIPGATGHKERVERVHGLFVGVSTYVNHAYATLENAAGDAAVLAEAFDERCGLATKKVLVNQQATHAAIRAAVREIAAKAGPEDLFVFHFSGHGLGLVSQENRTLKGLLFLHGASPLADLWRGEFGEEVIDLDLLESEWDGLGLRAKHRFVILDSCYGGIAAYPRVIYRPSPLGDTVRYRLAQRATYVLSGGGAEQEVLDGPPGGRGLLTGELIKLLSEEPAQVDNVDGKIYLSVGGLFSRVDWEVNAAARELASTQQAVALAGNRSVGARVRNPQVPQQLVRRGQGHIFLPLKRTDRITIAPDATTTPAPPPTSPAGNRSAGAATLGDWGAETELARANPDYATAWRELAQLLAAGPRLSAACALEVAVEPSMRVSGEAVRRAIHQPPPAPGLSVVQWLEDDEAMRQRVPGAEWVGVSEIDANLTTVHELGFELYNLGASPAYFYLVSLDDRGRVRLLSGHTETEARLSSRHVTPRPQISAGDRVWPLGWALRDAGGERAFLVVASVEPWPELVAAVKKLNAAGVGNPPARRAGLAVSLPKWLGAVTGARLAFRPAETQRLPGDVTPITLRSAGGWLGVTWCWPVVEAQAEFVAAP